MDLKKHLQTLTKKELVDIARDMNMQRYSNLRKAELVEIIALLHCDKEVLRPIFASLTDEEIALYKKQIKGYNSILPVEIMPCMKFHDLLLGVYDDINDTFVVFDDLRKHLSFLDDEDFKEEQAKKGWLTKCINFFKLNYGIATIDVFYKLYSQGVKVSIDDMLRVMHYTPLRFAGIKVECTYEGNHAYPDNHPMHSDIGTVVALSYYDDRSYARLLRDQGDKPFYIPTKEEIDTLYRHGYDIYNRYYLRLEKKCKRMFKIPDMLLNALSLHLYQLVVDGRSPGDFFTALEDMGAHIESIDQANELLPYVTDAYNNTRTIYNRGHTPTEMSHILPRAKKPTIVPGSTQAAKMLRDMQPRLQGMNIQVDVNANAMQVNVGGKKKKIYPNDPCPCGSGKKYKKCCRP